MTFGFGKKIDVSSILIDIYIVSGNKNLGIYRLQTHTQSDTYKGWDWEKIKNGSKLD